MPTLIGLQAEEIFKGAVGRGRKLYARHDPFLFLELMFTAVLNLNRIGGSNWSASTSLPTVLKRKVCRAPVGAIKRADDSALSGLLVWAAWQDRWLFVAIHDSLSGRKRALRSTPGPKWTKSIHQLTM